MIESLEDARRWYVAVKTLVGMMERIARRYWDEDSGKRTIGETLFRDEKLKEYPGTELQDLAKVALDDLDDLAVLLSFSVFEANVRDRTLEEMDRELTVPPRHPALLKAVADARDAVEHGSFGRLTEAYKFLDADARTQVDQVRQYRNWVAHGRRGFATNNVAPEDAFARLGRFLKMLDEAPPATPDAERPPG